jgi:hypothetical protein
MCRHWTGWIDLREDGVLVSQELLWEACRGRGDVFCRPERRKYQRPDKREVAGRISIIQARKHTIGEGVLRTNEKYGTGCYWWES